MGTKAAKSGANGLLWTKSRPVSEQASVFLEYVRAACMKKLCRPRRFRLEMYRHRDPHPLKRALFYKSFLDVREQRHMRAHPFYFPRARLRERRIAYDVFHFHLRSNRILSIIYIRIRPSTRPV